MRRVGFETTPPVFERPRKEISWDDELMLLKGR
jgi:hypothetical protein